MFKTKKNKEKIIPPFMLIFIVMIIFLAVGMALYVEPKTQNISKINDSKRNITELNCKALQDYFENGRQCKGIWPQRVCKYPKASSDTILYQILIRNCIVQTLNEHNQ